MKIMWISTCAMYFIYTGYLGSPFVITAIKTIFPGVHTGDKKRQVIQTSHYGQSTILTIPNE